VANQEHLQVLQHGVKRWNKWRQKHPEIRPDLSGAEIPEWAELSGINFSESDLSEVFFIDTKLVEANFFGANLERVSFSLANLYNANLMNAFLMNAHFAGAILCGATLKGANLEGAAIIESNFSDVDFTDAFLTHVIFQNSDVTGANFSNAVLLNTSFGDMDLSEANGLDLAGQLGPSTIGVDTLYKSGGKIPKPFLLNCGLPEQFITFMPALIKAVQPIQFFSCFISYSSQDEEFAKQLHARLRDARVPVWFAPEDLKGGEKLHEQLERAIESQDRLIVVLSEHSLKSEWVMTEIREARRVEHKHNQRKLFPISLVDFKTLKKWRCFDAEIGKDLAIEVREYFIPDFSNWRDRSVFESGVERLLRDLRAAAAEKNEL
jgi:uncharacterized protein YjbI with pentapeptide repeats